MHIFFPCQATDCRSLRLILPLLAYHHFKLLPSVNGQSSIFFIHVLSRWWYWTHLWRVAVLNKIIKVHVRVMSHKLSHCRYLDMKNGGCPNDQFDRAELSWAKGNLANVRLVVNWNDVGYERKRSRCVQLRCSSFTIVVIANFVCFYCGFYSGRRIGKR